MTKPAAPASFEEPRPSPLGIQLVTTGNLATRCVEIFEKEFKAEPARGTGRCRPNLGFETRDSSNPRKKKIYKVAPLSVQFSYEFLDNSIISISCLLTNQ